MCGPCIVFNKKLGSCRASGPAGTFFCIVGKDDVSYITKNCKNDINDDVENTQCFISLQLAGGGSWEYKCMTPL